MLSVRTVTVSAKMMAVTERRLGITGYVGVVGTGTATAGAWCASSPSTRTCARPGNGS